MPFKSKAQQGFMFAKHPKLAEEFAKETPSFAKLPEHVKKMNEGGEVEEDSQEWDRIKNFVGGANKKSKHPLEQEAERMRNRDTQHFAEGGIADFQISPDQNDPFGGQPPLSPAQPIPHIGTPVVPHGTPSLMPSTPPVAPMAAPSPAAPPTDYNAQASGILGGITPDAINRLMQSLSQQGKKAQLGAGIAGIGDAIASVGDQQPGHMRAAEENIQKQKELGMTLPGQMAAAGKEQFGLSQTLQAQDPNSPYSKIIQNAERPTLLKLGWSADQISKAPAIAIEDATKNSLTYEDTQAKYGLEKAIHEETIGLQKAQLENTKEYQKGQQDIERQNQRLQHPILSHFTGNNAPTYAPDVISYAQKHGITPEQAQAVKLRRSGGQ